MSCFATLLKVYGVFLGINREEPSWQVPHAEARRESRTAESGSAIVGERGPSLASGAEDFVWRLNPARQTCRFHFRPAKGLAGLLWLKLRRQSRYNPNRFDADTNYLSNQSHDVLWI